MVDLVHFMFFVLISFAFVSQCKPSCQWNMGLKLPQYLIGLPPSLGKALSVVCIALLSPYKTTDIRHRALYLIPREQINY